MLLAIDVGNTNTVFALHNGSDWVGQWRSASDATRTADEYAIWLRQLMALEGYDLSQLDACIISSVVPQALFNFRNLARRYMSLEPMVVGEGSVNLGVEVRIRRPEQAGADRLVTTIGAFIQHGGPLIVIDSGTATTFDIVGEDGAFEGGIICPGINLSMKALHDAAAQLPRIAISKPDKVIGGDTVSAMQSGVFWGYISLIDGLITRIKSEYGKPMKVIATGGVASLFKSASSNIDVYDQDLMLKGLYEIYRRNK